MSTHEVLDTVSRHTALASPLDSSGRRRMLPGRLSRTMLAAAVCAGTAAWLSLGILAVIDAGGRRIGVLPPVWLLAVFVLLAIVSVAVARIPTRAGLLLFLSLLLLLPWLPLPVPDVFLVWTGPIVWLVWGAIGICMLATIALKIQTRGVALLRDARTAPTVAAMLAFGAFLAVQLGQGPSPTGDEPHYLVIAQSLLDDGDVKVANNYERGDYLRYYPGFLSPHFSRPGLNGELYSIHAPGLPVLVAPAFAVGGYRAVVVWVAALVALGSAFVWKAAYVFTRDAGAAWFGWAAVTLTVPVVLHGTLVYPDPVAGMLIAGGVLALVQASTREHETSTVTQAGDQHAAPWSPWGSCGLGLAVGFLPWLHTRLALPAAILGLVLVLRIGRGCRSGTHWRGLAAFGAPIALSVCGWLAFFRIAYGTFNPAAPYSDQLPIAIPNIASGLLGLIADQEFGLVPNAPISLLWLGGFWSLFKRDRRLCLELLLIVGPYAIASSGYPMWWAGASPPARLLVPTVFPAGIALAALWFGQDGRGRTISLTLLVASVLLAAVLAFGGDGGLAYNRGTGRALWLDWACLLVDLPRGFPSFFRTTSATTPVGSAIGNELVRPAVLWCIALLAGWNAFRAIDRRFPATQRVRVILAPACLLAAFAAGVAATWRGEGGAHLLPTRAQIGLLRGDDQRLRSLYVQPFPARAITAADARARLALTTSPLDAAPSGALLFLTEVPPGRYNVRVTLKPSARGALVLGVGRASVPVARWSLSAAPVDVSTLVLPVTASTVVVKGDEDATRSVEEVALVPIERMPQAGPTGARARDGARYGSVVVYAIDDRLWLEPNGFWIMGERQPEVVITTDKPASSIELDVRNIPTSNRVRLWAGRWSSERTLGPDEHWRVRVPIAGLGPAVVVGFKVERGVRTDRRDRRLLGCWVEVR